MVGAGHPDCINRLPGGGPISRQTPHAVLPPGAEVLSAIAPPALQRQSPGLTCTGHAAAQGRRGDRPRHAPENPSPVPPPTCDDRTSAPQGSRCVQRGARSRAARCPPCSASRVRVACAWQPPRGGGRPPILYVLETGERAAATDAAAWQHGDAEFTARRDSLRQRLARLSG